jgi:hypothetical protein
MEGECDEFAEGEECSLPPPPTTGTSDLEKTFAKIEFRQFLEIAANSRSRPGLVMDAFSNAAVWDTIAQGKTIEDKSYGAAAMITDTESPPTSMAILPTPQQEVVEQTSLPAAFFKGFSCAACDAEDGLFDFCDACRRRAAMVRPPSASRPHVVFPLAALSNVAHAMWLALAILCVRARS